MTVEFAIEVVCILSIGLSLRRVGGIFGVGRERFGRARLRGFDSLF
jgi:hypothetical protein